MNRYSKSLTLSMSKETKISALLYAEESSFPVRPHFYSSEKSTKICGLTYYLAQTFTQTENYSATRNRELISIIIVNIFLAIKWIRNLQLAITR